MKKRFYLNIGNDDILFRTIDMEDENTLKNVEDERIFAALSNNPKIINITNLGYFPYVGAEWDGEKFLCEHDRELPRPGGVTTLQYFVFLVDNKYSTFCALNPGYNSNDMLIAALSSDPKIKIETIYE